MFSRKSSNKKPSSPPRPTIGPTKQPTAKTPSPPRPQAPPRKIPQQMQHFRPTKMTGQLVAVKPPPRPTTGPTKTPSPPRPPTGPSKFPKETFLQRKNEQATKTPSPPRPTTGPSKMPTKTAEKVVEKTSGGVWTLFKNAQQKTPPPPKPTTGPLVKPTTQWSTFDNISLNDIRGYAQQYKNKSTQDIYNVLIKKCSPEDAKKGVCKYDVEVLSRIIHSYPLGSVKAPGAPQVQRAPNNKTPLNSEQKSVDKKLNDLLRHITHDYDLVYKAKDIPIEQMLKRVNDLKSRLNEFKNASNNVKNTTEYKQRHAEYILLYKYIDTNKQILLDLINLKTRSKQLHKNPNNTKLAKDSIQLYKKMIDLNNSVPVQYRLLPHLDLKFILECLIKNQLFVKDPIFVNMKNQTFLKK